jgi:hypothetical protein
MTTHVPKFKNHIERLKFNISEMEVAARAIEERLIASEAQVADQERIINSNALLLQALQTQQLERLGEVQGQHICLQAEHVRVQRSLVESERVRNEKVEACNAFEEEVTGLRLESETLQVKTDILMVERRCQKKKEANAKRAVLRSFNWREANVDTSVLRGAVAFWAATPEGVQEDNEDKKRMSNKARKNILKVIVEQGFNGELHDELEKDFVKKKRFKVFTLVKKSDLESKFGGEAIGSIAHCENGHQKHMRGLIPSSGSIGNMQRKLNRAASNLGLSCMPETKTWCWGDSLGNTLREGVHRYIKAVYYDKHDTRVTEDDPYVTVLTGDLARVNLKGKFVTLCGAKECDRRLPSQQDTVGHQNNINQSRTLYVPAVAGYVKESDLMPLFEQLVEYFVEVEKQQFIVVDGQRYDNIFIKVLVVADMMFLQKFTGRGGGCAKTTHFCMFCSCINKFRHEGEPGGCDRCRSAGMVYDDNGLQLCRHHDHITPEKRARQQQRHAHLEQVLRGKWPARKKPLWEDQAGLRLACIERCVPGHTDLDGRPAYKAGDIRKIGRMTIAACNAWLDRRCAGINSLSLFGCAKY